MAVQEEGRQLIIDTFTTTLIRRLITEYFLSSITAEISEFAIFGFAPKVVEALLHPTTWLAEVLGDRTVVNFTNFFLRLSEVSGIFQTFKGLLQNILNVVLSPWKQFINSGNTVTAFYSLADTINGNTTIVK